MVFKPEAQQQAQQARLKEQPSLQLTHISLQLSAREEAVQRHL